MRIMEDGICRDMTAEEIAALEHQEALTDEPTMEERLARLEAMLAEKGVK